VNASPRFASNLRRRRIQGAVLAAACAAATVAGVALLGVLLWSVFAAGWERLSWQFLDGFPSRFPAKAGFKSALFGSLWLLGLTTLFSVPLGVGAAIYLEEYAPRNALTRLLELNVANLAGVPSIVFGVVGLAFFVRGMGFGPSVLSGALTLSLLTLPVVVIVSREAIRAVPPSLRLAAFAVGATRWQAIRHHVLPAALPGILTGVILSVCRAIGESAPLIMMGALTYVAFVPQSVRDPFTVMPIQIFNWASRPQPAFHEAAAAGIIVLLAILLTMNAAAILLRHRAQRRSVA
jgi:phosphate transport system permease protein